MAQQNKNYTVTRDFTDAKGRKWNLNQKFTGDEALTQEQLKAGNIAEEAPPSKDQQQNQQQQTSR